MTSLRDRAIIYAAAFLRSLGTGMCGVLLALHLNGLGWDVRQTGLLVTAGLAGIAAATLLTSLLADRARRFSLIVRAADVKGQEHAALEGLGLRALAQGFALLEISDEERLSRQFPVYDALYEYARHQAS